LRGRTVNRWQVIADLLLDPTGASLRLAALLESMPVIRRQIWIDPVPRRSPRFLESLPMAEGVSSCQRFRACSASDSLSKPCQLPIQGKNDE